MSDDEQPPSKDPWWYISPTAETYIVMTLCIAASIIITIFILLIFSDWMSHA